MRFRECRNIRQKDKNYLTQHGSVDHTKTPRLTETTYTFLYCRLGVMPQAEVSQPSSVQSERITEVMFSPGNSTSLPLGQQLYKWLIQHFDEETTEKLVSNLLDDQKLGIWFYDVVDIIGINEEHRKACQQAWIMHEILLTFLLKNTYYVIGSSIEGTFAAELTTPPGYVKLQLKLDDMQGKLSLNSDMKKFIHKSCKIDKCGRIFLHEIFNLPDESPFMYSTENKPALKNKNYYGVSFDNNIACRLKTWPTFAKEWISRNRFLDGRRIVWFNSCLYLDFSLSKGHPLSPEKDIEWRASFSLQERQLMFSLTDVQHKCYTVLKMFNREIIKSDCITSYHWKTCLFLCD
ncbi:unnamed protein product [Mytilus edulis]|uniref:Uncharacterized protein n=1 Tax=Mytilus edulis TaxID=6550 RepID=A0A8S3PZ34_MYTED|nr:unnamed protein product [Mytilus edulis]